MKSTPALVLLPGILTVCGFLLTGCGSSGGSHASAPPPGPAEGKAEAVKGKKSPRVKQRARAEGWPESDALPPLRLPPRPKSGPDEMQLPDGPASLEDGYETTSPDGRYVARLVEPDGGEAHFQITDRTTGLTGRVETLTQAMLMRWTPDSKALVAITHIAHGKDVRVMHRDDAAGAWVGRVVDPPHYSEGCEPLVIRPDGGRIHFKYQTSEDEENGGRRRIDYLSTFDYDIATGESSHVVSRRMKDWTNWRDSEWIQNRWRYNL